MTTMKKHMISLGLFAGISLTGAACAVEEEGEELEFRDTIGCNCGLGNSNSAHVNLYPIDHLHLGGLANGGGVTLHGVKGPKDKKVYELRTAGDELYAWDPEEGVVATGAGLVGWTIRLFQTTSAKRLEVHILGYDPAIPLEYDPGNTISGYAFGYIDPETPSETYSVCPASHAYPNAIAATIVRGELYYDNGDVVPNNEWFTIACFGNAVAKTKLFGYGPQETVPGTQSPATPSERMATIRMITADYCGDGTSFTVDGTPLDWKNASGGVQPTGYTGFDNLEALWTKEGAICIKEPRLHSVADVQDHCDVPICSLQDYLNADFDWITWQLRE